jgi:2-polyprenyl-3-methyl-5-hydroxy-6-metoxy-1,4-benzoquinol methylase
MTIIKTAHFSRMQQRYREGNIPWDDHLPPPEIQAIVQEASSRTTSLLQPGRVLDLGCGTGRASIYLAQHGWQATGVDFVPEAIAIAQQRAQTAGVANQITFVNRSVTDLHFLSEPYDLAVDVGCLHGMPTLADELAYAAGVIRLVRPGGRYILFARLHEPELVNEDQHGIAEAHITTLFAQTFTITDVAHGRTSTRTGEWASAWFWMVRNF